MKKIIAPKPDDGDVVEFRACVDRGYRENNYGDYVNAKKDFKCFHDQYRWKRINMGQKYKKAATGCMAKWEENAKRNGGIQILVNK